MSVYSEGCPGVRVKDRICTDQTLFRSENGLNLTNMSVDFGVKGQ